MAHIVARNIFVEFPIYGASSRSLKKHVLRAATGGLISSDDSDHVVIRAISGASFEFRNGDRVGLVGHNGSGKSTLLRVLAGTYEPVRGELEVEGSIASMLNITLGMDPEATGYENIFMRAALMGLGRAAAEKLVEQVVDFSELGNYIDMPMRTYSSGMAMRLAFAISTCVTPDILLMDEWLSVGDAEFSVKAKQRLDSLIGKSSILVLASHDEALIRGNCNRILHLSHGEITSIENL